MSIDRRKDRINAPQKPLMPRLAASATPHRSGPAPKLAGFNSPTNGTPIRRPLVDNDANTPPRLADSRLTPVKSTTSPNVTPRSSARRSRAGSAQPTPTAQVDKATGSPRPTSLLSQDPLCNRQLPSLEDPIDDTTKRKRIGPRDEGPAVTSTFPFSFTADKTSGVLQTPSNKHIEPPTLFEARQDPARSPPVRPLLHKKTSSFVYANGDASSLGLPQHARPVEDSDTKGDPLIRTPPISHGRSSPVQQRIDRAASPTKPMSPTLVSLPARNVILPGSSPPREGFHLSYRKGASQIMRPSPLSPHEEISQRQISLDSTSSRRHSRGLSSSSLESSPRKPKRQSNSPRHNDSFPQLSARFNLPTPKASPIVSPANGAPSPRDSVTHLLDTSLVDRAIDRVQSPTSTLLSNDSNSNNGFGAPNRSDTANDARRERKILDLQISNSSLMAINRTLEKEMRRQKAEMKRYKRATRNFTRASLASGGSATRSGRMSMFGGEQDDEDFEDDSDDSEMSEEASNDESRSQDRSSDGDKLPRDHYRSRSRVALDLSKHKALLVASTALNQSLKRCLCVSDDLINGGKKALEYTAPSFDLPIAARVLSPEEVDPDGLMDEEAVDYFGLGRQSGGDVDDKQGADDSAGDHDADDRHELDPVGGEDDVVNGDNEAAEYGNGKYLAPDDRNINPGAGAEINTDNILPDAANSPPPSLPRNRFRSASSLLSHSPSNSGSTPSPGGVLHSVPSLD